MSGSRRSLSLGNTADLLPPMHGFLTRSLCESSRVNVLRH